MRLHPAVFVIAGMLIPAAYARAPQSAVLLPATAVLHGSAYPAAEHAKQKPRATAASLRGTDSDSAVLPIYATQGQR